METEIIFEYLEKFKNFPTYQFERRIDAFMLPYLDKAINKRFDINDDNLIFIYPEFPLKRTISVGNKFDKLSEYADYLLYSPKLNIVYLIEFKTEVKSINEDQFKTYLNNSKNGWKDLLVYYFDKAINNNFWKKFVHGLIHFQNEARNLLGDKNNWQLNDFFNKSKGVHIRLNEIKKSIIFENIEEPKIKFIYLAPQKAKNKLEGFKEMHDKNQDFYEGLMSLTEFAEYADNPLKSLLIKIEKVDKTRINNKP